MYEAWVSVITCIQQGRCDMLLTIIGGSAISSGANGILVPLGFENFMSLAQAQMFYNYIAVIFLLLVAATTGSREEAAHCVFIPILAGMEALFGWLVFPNQLNAIACLIIAGFFGVCIYMNEQNRDKNGISGPGSKYLNIMMFIIIFQVCLGVTPVLGIFNPQVTSAPVYSQPYCPPSATCGAYSNIQFQSSTTTVQNAGGLGVVTSVLYGLTNAFIGMITFVVNAFIGVMTSASTITNIIESVWPGVTATPIYLAFWAALSVVFWATDVIFLINAYLKMFPNEGSL